MFRYLLFADGTTQFNEATMALIEADKADGWKVTDAIKVRVENTADGYKETVDPLRGVPACKIIFS